MLFKTYGCNAAGNQRPVSIIAVLMGTDSLAALVLRRRS